MLIDGYEIDMDHEDAYAEGCPNSMYIESEKKRIDAEDIMTAKRHGLFKDIKNPVCAKCQKPVDEFGEYSNPGSLAKHFYARCHVETETAKFTFHQLQNLEKGNSDLGLGEVFAKTIKVRDIDSGIVILFDKNKLHEIVEAIDFKNMFTPAPGEYVITGPQAGNSDLNMYIGYVVQVRKEGGAFGSDIILIRHPNGTLGRHENQCYCKVNDF